MTDHCSGLSPENLRTIVLADVVILLGGFRYFINQGGDITAGLDLVVLAKPWRKGGEEGESKRKVN